MPLSRRTLLTASAVVLPFAGAHTAAALTWQGRSAVDFGARANSDADQTTALQRAIDAAARDNVPLWLPPGRYRCASLRLPSGLNFTGQPGASILALAAAPALMVCDNARDVTLAGLTFDGRGIPLPARRGLLHGQNIDGLHIRNCMLVASGGEGFWLEETAGDIRNTTFTGCARTAIVSFNARGLLVAQNIIRETRENGIEILRHAPGDDGTLVIDNRIESIVAGPGGSGQYGNGIIAYRAGNVIVRGNRIRDCDYSAVRGNSANNIQILGNSISAVREVAIYSEFSFEAAVIANNSVDGAALGVSVCNFNEGGRIAAVTGNIVRNLLPNRPSGSADGAGGIGVYVEADAAVTGNVIEKAPFVGIMAGWGKYLRDVTITGNVVREAFIGVGISTTSGTGHALVNGNVIAEAARGAVVGMDHDKAVTGDLARAGAEKFQHIAIGMNQIR